MQHSRLVLSAALALGAVQGLRADEWSKRWNVSGKPELRISAGDASVTVEAGAANVIDAHLTTVGYSIGPSGIRIDERQNGDKVSIDIKVPSMHWSIGMKSIRLVVQVPRELVADLHTGDGSIHIKGLQGEIRADTGDGSIQGDSVDGSLDFHTGDGSIHVAGRFDKLQLRTNDGSVDVEARDGSRMNGDWHIQTGDGSVHLRVPRTLAADLEARTGDGSIRMDAPGATNRVKSEHMLGTKLNGGGPALLLRTGDGSISISAI